MKKTTATIEGLDNKINVLIDKLDQNFERIDQNFERIDKNFERIDQRFERIDKNFERIDQRFEGIDERFERIEINMGSIQENVDFLVKHAVMREDVRQIVREEIDPIKSTLHSAMDVIIGKHKTFEGESLALRYHHDLLDRRVGVVEKTMKLSKAV